MNPSLRDRWVVITGASSGFGAAAAVAFAAQGARVLLGARRQDRLQEVARQALAAGAPAAHPHPLDVGQTPSVETFTAWIRTLTPQVHILINNAGGALGLEPVADGKDGDWESMMQSNVLGSSPCLYRRNDHQAHRSGGRSSGASSGQPDAKVGTARCAIRH